MISKRGQTTASPGEIGVQSTKKIDYNIQNKNIIPNIILHKNIHNNNNNNYYYKNNNMDNFQTVFQQRMTALFSTKTSELTNLR